MAQGNKDETRKAKDIDMNIKDKNSKSYPQIQIHIRTTNNKSSSSKMNNDKTNIKSNTNTNCATTSVKDEDENTDEKNLESIMNIRMMEQPYWFDEAGLVSITLGKRPTLFINQTQQAGDNYKPQNILDEMLDKWDEQEIKLSSADTVTAEAVSGQPDFHFLSQWKTELESKYHHIIGTPRQSVNFLTDFTFGTASDVAISKGYYCGVNDTQPKKTDINESSSQCRSWSQYEDIKTTDSLIRDMTDRDYNNLQAESIQQANEKYPKNKKGKKKSFQSALQFYNQHNESNEIVIDAPQLQPTKPFENDHFNDIHKFKTLKAVRMKELQTSQMHRLVKMSLKLYQMIQITQYGFIPVQVLKTFPNARGRTSPTTLTLSDLLPGLCNLTRNEKLQFNLLSNHTKTFIQYHCFEMLEDMRSMVIWLNGFIESNLKYKKRYPDASKTHKKDVKHETYRLVEYVNCKWKKIFDTWENINNDDSNLTATESALFKIHNLASKQESQNATAKGKRQVASQPITINLKTVSISELKEEIEAMYKEQTEFARILEEDKHLDNSVIFKYVPDWGKDKFIEMIALAVDIGSDLITQQHSVTGICDELSQLTQEYVESFGAGAYGKHAITKEIQEVSYIKEVMRYNGMGIPILIVAQGSWWADPAQAQMVDCNDVHNVLNNIKREMCVHQRFLKISVNDNSKGNKNNTNQSKSKAEETIESKAQNDMEVIHQTLMDQLQTLNKMENKILNINNKSQTNTLIELDDLQSMIELTKRVALLASRMIKRFEILDLSNSG